MKRLIAGADAAEVFGKRKDDLVGLPLRCGDRLCDSTAGGAGHVEAASTRERRPESGDDLDVATCHIPAGKGCESGRNLKKSTYHGWALLKIAVGQQVVAADDKHAPQRPAGAHHQDCQPARHGHRH
jgi:hypothetical protein